MGHSLMRWIWPAVLFATCRERDASRDLGEGDSASVGATPVPVAEIRTAPLAVAVSAPGRTDVLRPLHVRAPFAGALAALHDDDGDRVAVAICSIRTCKLGKHGEFSP